MSQRRLFGIFLIEEGFITPEQLYHGLTVQRRQRHLYLGEMMVRMGLLTREELEAHLRRHLRMIHSDNEPHTFFGQYLVDEGIISKDDLNNALTRQKRLQRQRIGDILVDLGYIQRAQLEAAVRHQLVEITLS